MTPYFTTPKKAAPSRRDIKNRRAERNIARYLGLPTILPGNTWYL